MQDVLVLIGPVNHGKTEMVRRWSELFGGATDRDGEPVVFSGATVATVEATRFGISWGNRSMAVIDVPGEAIDVEEQRFQHFHRVEALLGQDRVVGVIGFVHPPLGHGPARISEALLQQWSARGTAQQRSLVPQLRAMFRTEAATIETSVRMFERLLLFLRERGRLADGARLAVHLGLADIAQFDDDVLEELAATTHDVLPATARFADLVDDPVERTARLERIERLGELAASQAAWLRTIGTRLAVHGRCCVFLGAPVVQPATGVLAHGVQGETSLPDRHVQLPLYWIVADRAPTSPPAPQGMVPAMPVPQPDPAPSSRWRLRARALAAWVLARLARWRR